MATFATFIGLSVSISLGAISLSGASVSGVATVLTKKYQKKLSKGLLCWWIFIVPEVVLNLVYPSIFSGLAALMSADIA